MAAAALTAAAADNGLSSNQRLLGHTVSDNIDYEGIGFGQAGDYTIGACYGPSELQPYAGCKVVGIRLAVSRDLGRSKIYLQSVDGQNATPIQSQSQRLYSGWNNIFFNGDGYEIKEGDRLFYGFDYTETDDMVTAKQGAICVTGENAIDSFMLLQGGKVYDVTGGGALCISLIVDASSLPEDDMAVTFFDTGFKYKSSKDKMECFLQLTNTGRKPVTSYRMGYCFDDLEPQYADKEESIECGESTTWQNVIAIPADLGIGAHTFKAWVAAVNGVELTENTSRGKSSNFALYANSVVRGKALFEAYNNLSSPYASTFNKVVEAVEAENADVLSVVNVYAPGTTFGVAEAGYLHDWYAYTLPSFTINRSYFPAENHIAYDINDYILAMPEALVNAMLSDMVTQDLGNPSFATLDVSNSFDVASRKLTTKVSGTLLEEAAAIYGNVGVTLMMVEDGVTSFSKSSDNVFRGFVGSPYGDPLAESVGDYEAEFSTVLPSGWNPQKMEVVAFLTKQLPENAEMTENELKDYDVINAASAKVIDPSGVDGIVAEEEAGEAEYFTLSGVKVDAASLQPGVYIRKAGGKARKFIKGAW